MTKTNRRPCGCMKCENIFIQVFDVYCIIVPVIRWQISCRIHQIWTSYNRLTVLKCKTIPWSRFTTKRWCLGKKRHQSQTPFHAAVSTESTDKRCSPFGQDKNPSQPLVFPFGFSSSPASSSNCSDLPAGLCGFMNSPPLIEKTQSSTQQPCLTADFSNIHDESLELINSKCNNVNICYL